MLARFCFRTTPYISAVSRASFWRSSAACTSGSLGVDWRELEHDDLLQKGGLHKRRPQACTAWGLLEAGGDGQTARQRLRESVEDVVHFISVSIHVTPYTPPGVQNAPGVTPSRMLSATRATHTCGE